MVEGQLRKIKKSELFALFLTQPHGFTLIHTFIVTLHKEKNDCKRALAKNHYESCYNDKQTP